MKKTKFSLCFCDCLGVEFSTSLELPNSVNPIDLLSQLFVDYSVTTIDLTSKTIRLVCEVESDGKCDGK